MNAIRCIFHANLEIIQKQEDSYLFVETFLALDFGNIENQTWRFNFFCVVENTL